ncbi:MAG: NADP-dependent phosphogluconate dehydrogenase [Armatimonadetes bacterium]|nr:NADP-dependent phosphogluconate dehydrogenase [Armatimonadota bacterium]
MNQAVIGLIGLGVMGENLILNIEDKGFPVAVFNRTTSKVDDFLARNPGKRLIGCHSPEELIASLERPRQILLLVQAGPAVDAVIGQFRPLLEPGDILVDAGNSWFQDTERRALALAPDGIRYVGMGVSGGEAGARHGPSLMPGGPRDAVETLMPILTRIAAQTDEGPCVTYIGPGGAGHYVKMVHNGIEYGAMQLIAEAYDLLKRLAGLDAPRLHEVFARWNQGELQSYLIEIAADIFTVRDPDTGQPLVELILDTAGQKGTGKWTSQNALDLGAALPTINAAVEARLLSSYKRERVAASETLCGPAPQPPADVNRFIDQVEGALYAAKICAYAQGMALLAKASAEYGYSLELAEIARIWKGGCIIRARLLDHIRRAYQRRPDLPNLLLDEEFRDALHARQDDWRAVVATAARNGIPTLAFGASLAYYDMYRTARLPTNLTQAQRDYFGAHEYQRIDREGVFHTDWLRLACGLQ